MIVDILLIVGALACAITAGLLMRRGRYDDDLRRFHNDLRQLHDATDNLKVEVGKALLPAVRRIEAALARFHRD